MSSQDAVETSGQRLASSDKISVEIHLFGCGQGDTILVHLPENRWVLIDCHLPVRDGTRERFFQFLRSKEIERLDLIFQTHPDLDHFHGMIEVLEYFACEGRAVGRYCDGGLTAEAARGLIWSDPLDSSDKTHYGRLEEHLDKFDDSFFSRIDDEHEPISPKGYKNRIDFIPVGPSAGLNRRITRRDTRKVAENPKAKVEANALSVVLVLSIREGDRVCNVLLTGDADSDSMELALDAWSRKSCETSTRADFDVIKIPHHGSIESRSTRLCKAKRNDRECCVAAVSVGERYDVLPDRAVLRDYLNAGWTVMLTTVRRGAARSNRPGGLADRGRPLVRSFEAHTITITVTADGVVEHSPEAAVVQTGDLVLYESAAPE